MFVRHTCGVSGFIVGSGHVGVIPRPSSSRCRRLMRCLFSSCRIWVCSSILTPGGGGTGTAKITEVQHRRGPTEETNEKQHRRVNDEHETQCKTVRDKSRERIQTKHKHSAASLDQYTETTLICIRIGQKNCTPQELTIANVQN